MSADEILAHLSALGLEPLGVPEPLAAGWGDARLWRVETASGPCVLRMFPNGDEPVARQETQVMEYLHGLGFPVPRVVASGSLDERPGMLIEWLEGIGAEQALLRGHDPYHLGEQFGRTLARLHGVDAPEGIPHATTWPVTSAYPRRLLDRLEEVSSGSAHLLHLDFHPANVLVDGGVISGVIDWTNARVGDPRFDIARTYVLLRTLPGLEYGLKQRFQPLIRPFIGGLLRAYRSERGGIRDIAPFLAWAGYGLVYDMGRKPLDARSQSVANELETTLEALRERLRKWMEYSGLDSELP